MALKLYPLGIQTFERIRKENKLGGKEVFMPVRIAVTGQQHGPDIDKLIALMGKETYEARLRQTAAALGIEL